MELNELIEKVREISRELDPEKQFLLGAISGEIEKTASRNAALNIQLLQAKSDVAMNKDKVCDIRKKWQAAETLICSMCGHFDHKTDGNVVYGNQDCGEIVGYPCCKKFTPWIPVSVRMPEARQKVLVYSEGDGINTGMYDGHHGFRVRTWESYIVPDEITHWMPLPVLPKEVSE